MHRRGFGLGLATALVALVSGCQCGKAPPGHPPEPQPPCASPKKPNAQGLCVACVANADCAVGQQCNLLSGTCEPIVPSTQADGGQDLGCFPGARRCKPDGRAVQDCVSIDGGAGWQDTTPCTASQTCNPQTLTCAVCIPGETLCNPEGSSSYERCKDDGTGFDPQSCDADGGPGGYTCKMVTPHQTSADGGAPTAGLAACRLCNPGDSRCTTIADGGVGVLTCDSTGTTYEYTSCFPTNACVADGGLAPYCQLPVCYPGQRRCTAAANTSSGREVCNGDGSGWVADDCQSSTVCGPSSGEPAACLSPCDVVKNSSSYFGCDYWGAVTSNHQLDPAYLGNSSNGSPGTTASEFAFVVGNTSTMIAHVTVDTPGLNQVASVTVSPGTTQEVRLPWRSICGTGQAQFGYHLQSDVPVTVYQFNPLRSALQVSAYDMFGRPTPSCNRDSDCQTFAIPQSQLRTCDPSTHKCIAYSYSNDASLLLPTHLLGTSYVVVAQDHESVVNPISGATDALPGLMAVVSTQDNTKVEIRFAGTAMATSDVSSNACPTTQGSVGGQAAGSVQDYLLNRGDVLHFWSASAGGSQTCDTVTTPNGPVQLCLWPNDFTGTVVTSVSPDGAAPAKPIAVFGGADCSFKPYNKFACDHVEEEMFPFSTWGKSYVGVKSASYAGSTSSYPDFWRLVSACGPSSCPNGTTIAISPPISSARQSGICTTSGGATTCHLPPLTAGQAAPWVEFQHNSSFVATSDQPAVLAQYFVSEQETGSNIEGDPSLVLAPPIEQWRTDYTVLAPTTYVHNYLNLMIDGQGSSSCATCSGVQVDAVVVPSNEWANIPGTNYWSAVHALSNASGSSHAIQSTHPVGVVVYGYDSYVSYGYTGGLDLKSITSINPGG